MNRKCYRALAWSLVSSFTSSYAYLFSAIYIGMLLADCLYVNIQSAGRLCLLSELPLQLLFSASKIAHVLQSFTLLSKLDVPVLFVVTRVKISVQLAGLSKATCKKLLLPLGHTFLILPFSLSHQLQTSLHLI